MIRNSHKPLGGALTVAVSVLLAHPVAAGSGKSVLPSPDTEAAIQFLATEPALRAQPGAKPEFRELSVDPEKVAPAQRDKLSLDSDGMASLPFVAPNTMILQFESDVGQEEIESFLESRDLKVVRTYPKIGAVQVEADLTGYFQPQIGDDDANDSLLRGVVSAIRDFESDPRVRSAAPDVMLTDQSQHSGEITITNLLTPSDVVVSDASNATETMDWGIADIEADQLWDMPGARDGALLGVMDVGFHRHEDITFIGLPPDTDVDDHGNHVAAIACARHNGVGVRGVLPNCFVRARSGDVFIQTEDGGQVLQFLVLFSQILGTLERFVDQQDEVRTFNVSLGYNWRSNFGINPDLPESSDWRALVASQGAILVSLLELAEESGKVIFSAAGNDSTGLADPIDAKYASPFNWAAITAREQGISENGVIVEGHDSQGRRAPFSNEGGHISCPGVNVFSAVVFDPQGRPSRSAYGTMSGTSMASPYCAAGHQLFGLVRPRYTGVEAIECMLQSAASSTSGAPMLRLGQVVDACPPRS